MSSSSSNTKTSLRRLIQRTPSQSRSLSSTTTTSKCRWTSEVLLTSDGEAGGKEGIWRTGGARGRAEFPSNSRLFPTHSNSFCLHDLHHWLTSPSAFVSPSGPTPNLALDRPSFSHRILQVWEMLLLLCCVANCQMTWPPAFPIAPRASASSH